MSRCTERREGDYDGSMILRAPRRSSSDVATAINPQSPVLVASDGEHANVAPAPSSVDESPRLTSSSAFACAFVVLISWYVLPSSVALLRSVHSTAALVLDSSSALP
jgi:hypothetical protein